jgi:acyl-CoA reductase-like NAD-dependent aldehyde dehydrogenase
MEPGSSATPTRRRCNAEKAGVNQIIIDSADDFAGAARNIAFSLALYTGQMCTAPQNIYVPRDGIDTGDGHMSFDHVAQGLAAAVQKLVGDPARAVEILGAVVNDGVAERIHAARSLGAVVHDSQALVHPQFPTPASRHHSWSSSTPPTKPNI